jgi:ankyrin repeat protein
MKQFYKNMTIETVALGQTEIIRSMKAKLCVWMLLLGAALAQAQTNGLTLLLQQGLFDEEASHDLNAAIADYQSLAKQFDTDRQVAATAIYRLGECYRKLGQTNEAAAQYQRILHDFSDQTTLTTLSQQDLTGMGMAVPPRLMTTAQSQSAAENLQQKLQAMLAHSGADTNAESIGESPDDQDQEILRIKQMIQNSPDLINAPGNASNYPPLIQAAISDHLRVAHYLLDNNVNVNVTIGNGETPLTMAAFGGHKAMVELLLSHGADVNAQGDAGETALHQTAKHGFQAVTEVLLTNHANVNALNNNGATPLFLAASSGQLKIVQRLLVSGANPNLKDARGLTPLNYAITAGSPEVVKVLLEAGTAVSTEDSFGRTPLSYAAEKNNQTIVNLLLNARADPNGGKLDAPIFSAIKQGNTNTLELLLRAGANPNLAGAFNLPGTTTANILNHSGHLTPLWMAISLDQLPVVQMLLQFKADPNDSVTDGQPLLFSVLSDTNMLEALLDAGAKVDPVSAEESQWTPLGAVASQNNAPAVEMLLKHGANPNVHNRNGITPLHWAAYHLADGKIFELLLTNKADPNVRSNDGVTPLDLVKEKLAGNGGSPEQRTLAGQLAGLLRQHGALDSLPNWDRIAVSRPSVNFTFPIFVKGTNSWNQFTLLETILNYYESSQSYSVPQGNNTWASYPANSMLPFPDLARVIIIRPSHGSTHESRLPVNLLNSTEGIDCSKDVPLEFGDVVEVPERDHSLGDRPVGLTDGQIRSIASYLKGNVQLVVRDQKVELPFYRIGSQSTIGAVLNQPEAQRMLLSSSDLSHVTVSRFDSGTGTNYEWVLDCSTPPSPVAGSSPPYYRQGTDANNPPPGADLWLRDGDVIKVPEKP